MGGFWSELLNKMPPWFWGGLSVLILLGVGVILWRAERAALYLAKAIGSGEQLLVLQRELTQKKAECEQSLAVTSQLTTSLTNVQARLAELNEIPEQTPQGRATAAHLLMSRAVELLASDVKHSPGELHRCGFWLKVKDTYVLAYASAGFPSEYTGVDPRTLTGSSLAAKAGRLRKTIHVEDVSAEDEFEPGPDPVRRYNAVVIVPITMGGDTIGVLTIDALRSLDRNAILIGQLYSGIIAGAVGHFLEGMKGASAPGGGDSRG